MGFLIKKWDDSQCINFIGGMVVISVGSYLMMNWIIGILLVTLIGFGILIWSFKLDKTKSLGG